MALWLNAFCTKHEDLSLDPMNPHKNLHLVAHIVTPALGTKDRQTPKAHCPPSTIKSVSFRFFEKKASVEDQCDGTAGKSAGFTCLKA